MWARQKRKLDGARRPHRDVRNRAHSLHGAKIFPSSRIVEAQDNRGPPWAKCLFPVRTSYNRSNEKTQSRYVCGG